MSHAVVITLAVLAGFFAFMAIAAPLLGNFTLDPATQAAITALIGQILTVKQTLLTTVVANLTIRKVRCINQVTQACINETTALIAGKLNAKASLVNATLAALVTGATTTITTPLFTTLSQAIVNKTTILLAACLSA